MKIMFFFNWEFSHFCHSLAMYVKNKYPDSKFSGVVVQRKQFPFLKEQSAVDYSLLLLEDVFNEYKSAKVDTEFLNQTEREYARRYPGSPYLWEMVYADRDISPTFAVNKYTDDEVKRIVQVLFKRFEKFIDENKPDFLVFDCIASLPAFVLYEVAKKRGVQPIGFTYSRVGDRTYFVSSPYDRPEFVLEEFERIQKTKTRPKKSEEMARSFLEEFRSVGIKPKYIQNMPVSEKDIFSFRNYLSRFVEYGKEYYVDEYHKDYTLKGKHPLWRANEKATFYARAKLLYKDTFEQPDYSESFAFFPLHLDPELATMVQAPPYVDQLTLIKLIARSLPFNFKLYVKEHPLMHSRGWRSVDFYKEIKKIPNVHLIDPGINSKELILNSKLVFSITGTAGFEAVLYKKPIILFGECVYSSLSNVVRAKDLMALPETVYYALNEFKHNDEEVLDFLTAIYEKSIPADLSALVGGVDPNITYEIISKREDFMRIANIMDKTFFSKKVESRA